MDFIKNIDCVDSGTENCPCYLAATGDCLVCSRLQGKEYCDCLWRGVCIYNEFVQNNHKINNPRKDFSALIVSKEQYSEDLYVITLDVGRGFALKAAVPGSYVFLQPLDKETYYHTPISIMKADTDKGFITVLIKAISAKTKALCSESERLIVRGIYRSGLCGMPKLKGRFGGILPSSKVLIITKGVGFAPAVNFIDWAGRIASIEVAIDTDKICDSVADAYLQKDLISQSEFLCLGSALGDSPQSEVDSPQSAVCGSQSAVCGLRQRILEGGYTAVVVLASDYYIGVIREIVNSMETPSAFVCSNNANICCGEGICGACSSADASGHMCKQCKCL